MNNFKYPGTDGYTAEFIKLVWSDSSSFVIKSLNFGYKRGQLSDSQKLETNITSKLYLQARVSNYCRKN